MWKECSLEQIRAYQKKWRAKPENKAKQLKYAFKKRARFQDAWMFILTSLGMTECFRCGYNRSFAAIDFHHVEPDKKESAISLLLKTVPTNEKLMELEKVVPLCRNCHAELHEELKKEILK